MIENELEPLSADLQSLLADEQAAPAMPSAMQARISARVAQSIAQPTLTSVEAASAGGEVAAVASTAVASKSLLLAGVAFALGVGAGVGGTLYATRSSETALSTVVVQDASVELALPVPDAEPVDAGIAVAVDADVPHVPKKSKADPIKREGSDSALVEPSDASNTGEFARERALLELARTAIMRGDASTALEELDKHARLYRKGRLAEERDALWVQALVQAGFPAKAKTKAARFKARYPRSLFLPVVDHALSELP